MHFTTSDLDLFTTYVRLDSEPEVDPDLFQNIVTKNNKIFRKSCHENWMQYEITPAAHVYISRFSN